MNEPPNKESGFEPSKVENPNTSSQPPKDLKVQEKTGNQTPGANSGEDITIPPSAGAKAFQSSNAVAGGDDATIPPARSPFGTPARHLSSPEVSNADATIPPRRSDSMTEEATNSAQSTPLNLATGDSMSHQVDSSSDWSQLEVNRTFGDYELIQEIARGGMGVVFKARQRKLNRLVALKMILTGQLASQDDVQRFYAEAESAANLDHPGIVSIFEVGQIEGQHFFSMAYIEGSSLAAKIKDGPLPPKDAARYTKKIVEAVQYAHENGVIHRDLKPANVLLDKLGQPKVMDFGLAKKTSGDSQITQAGQILGTPSYMPPEQAEGRIEDIGPGADIYSLGAILYCLLTGRPPFQAATSMDTLLQVIEKEPVSPRQVNGEVPKDLETICLKCLQKPIARRYLTAKELSEDLDRYLDGRPILARPVGRLERTVRWCKRNPVVAGLIASIAILLIGVTTNQTMAARRERGLRDFAVNAQKSAEENAKESRHRLVRQFVSNGIRLMDERDIPGALPWFVEALRLDPEHETIHRYRIANVLDQCPMPTQVWFHGGRVFHACFDHRGKHVVTCSEDKFARVWDVESGRKLAELPHKGAVVFAAVSSDDRLVVTASADSTAQVWEISTGKPIGSALKHDKAVSSAIFSPDGKRVLTTSEDKTARVWDTATGKPVFAPLLHNHPLLRAAFSPDGALIATAGGTQQKAYFGTPECRIWSATTGKQLHELPHEGCVMTVQFSPDGKRLATGTDNFIAMVWDPQTGKNLLPPIRDINIIYQVQFSPDGSKLATTSDQGYLRIWDSKTAEIVTTQLRQNGQVRTISFSPDGRRIASGSSDGTVFVWDAVSGEPVLRNLRHAGPVDMLECDPTGRRIVVASRDGTARVWDLSMAEPAPKMLAHPSRILFLRYSNDGKKIASTGYDGTVQVWDAATFKAIGPVLRHQREVRDVSFSKDSTKVLTASDDGTAQIWDANTGQKLTPPIANGMAIGAAIFSPDEKFILTSGQEDKKDTDAKVWDAATSKLLGVFSGHKAPVTHIRFSPDGTRIATMSRDQSACIWDFETRKPLSPFIPHGFPMFDMEFSADGELLATACGEPLMEGGGFARVWNGRTGVPIGPPVKHLNGVGRLCFSSDGTKLLTGSFDNTARVWNAQTSEPLTPPLKHQSQLNKVEFSPDGKLILTGSTDNTAKLWDTETGEAVSPPYRHSAWCLNAQFNPTGRWFATRCVDNVLRVFGIAYESRAIDDLNKVAQLLSGVQLFASGDSTRLTVEEYQQNWKSITTKHQNAFTASSEKSIAFHRRESVDASYARNWFAKARHIRSLMQLEPTKPAWQFEFARCLAEHGDYKNAIEQFSLAEKAGYVDPNADYRKAMCSLYTRDRSEFPKNVKSILDKLNTKSNPALVYEYFLLFGAWPGDPIDPAKMLELCQWLANAAKDDHDTAFAVAAVEFRLGKTQDALKRCESGLKIPDGTFEGHDWLVLSLIHSKLGRKAEAKKWLDKATEWMEREFNEKTKGVQGRNLFWQRKLILMTLREEAQKAQLPTG